VPTLPAVQRGSAVPETHYLLRVIFYDGLRWNLNRDNTIPIVAKLANPIIKKMIVEVVNECMGSRCPPPTIKRGA
jgi:hypothetical protein